MTSGDGAPDQDDAVRSDGPAARFARWRAGRARAKRHRAASRRENRRIRENRSRSLISSRDHPTPQRLTEEVAWRAAHGLEATERAAWAARRDRRGERCRHGGAWLTQAELARYERLLPRSSVPPVDVSDVFDERELASHYAGAWFDWEPEEGAWRYGFTGDARSFLPRLRAAAGLADLTRTGHQPAAAAAIEVVEASRSLAELEGEAQAIRADLEGLHAELGERWVGVHPDVRANRVRIEIEHPLPEHEAMLLARYGDGEVMVRPAPPLR